MTFLFHIFISFNLPDFSDFLFLWWISYLLFSSIILLTLSEILILITRKKIVVIVFDCSVFKHHLSEDFVKMYTLYCHHIDVNVMSSP